MFRTQLGLIIVSLSFATSLIPASSFAVDITACGQTVEAGDTGVLQTDLDCPIGYELEDITVGVYTEERATLDLNGHTLNGGTFSVFFEGITLIKGPGTISGSYVGMTSETYNSRITLENLTLSGHQRRAVYANSVKGYVRLKDVVLENNGDGSYGAMVIGGPRIKARNVTATGNQALVFGGGAFTLDNVTLDGNTMAVWGRGTIRNSSITNTTDVAVGSFFSVKLKNTTVTDSGPSGDGVDIQTRLKPRVVDSTCTHSQVCAAPPAGGGCDPQPTNWGVCTDD